MSSKPETVVVVGATGDMGKVICSALLADGLRVVGVARSADQLASLRDLVVGPSSGEWVPCAADIADDAAVELITRCLDGTVRAVVHGPGVPTAGGILGAPTSAITEAVNIKVGGFMRLVRAADPYLVARSRLIAIGGHYGFEPTAYAATAGVANAALANAVRQYSWTYGERGVTAHLLAPGPADTPRLHRVAQARAERDHSTVEEVLNEMREESALGAFTDVDQVAWGIRMLLAPEADALAGSTLFMDAGRRRGLP